MPMAHPNAPTNPHQMEIAHFRTLRSRERVNKTPGKAEETKKCVYNNFDIVIITETFSAQKYYFL